MIVAQSARFFVRREVRVDNYLCNLIFVRWVKSHRKKRINKKWHKRYGFIQKCTGKCYTVGSVLICCPCVYAELSKNEQGKEP